MVLELSGARGTFEPADMRLASKVLLGMEWLFLPDRPEAVGFVLTICRNWHATFR
ncbi:hypothetical protein [Piscinibacter terrae]|uniref:hypothetical protein n=1 Tax=Piscinibacter terrae TaxID=2496871 RepID=UPI0013868EF2|nr:hypothetical protein [Albitalea terrae]